MRTGSSAAREEIIEKFFSFSHAEFSAYSTEYGRRYGAGARSYLHETYSGWKAGTIGMSGQTCHRILTLVPKFLSRREQLQLLAYFLPEEGDYNPPNPKTTATSYGAYSYRANALSQPRGGWRTFEEIRDLHIAKLKNIEEIEGHLAWFVSDVFEKNEVADFTALLRHIAKSEVIRAYECLSADIASLRVAISPLSGNVPYSITYEAYSMVGLVASSLMLADESPQSLPTSAEPESLDKEAREVMAEILAERAFEKRRRSLSNQFSMRLAIDDVMAAYSGLSLRHDQYAEATVDGSGEAGIFCVKMSTKDIADLRRKEEYSKALFSGAIALVIALIYLGIANEWLFLAIFIIPPPCFIPLCAIYGAYQKYGAAKRDREDYERQTRRKQA